MKEGIQQRKEAEPLRSQLPAQQASLAWDAFEHKDIMETPFLNPDPLMVIGVGLKT